MTPVCHYLGTLPCRDCLFYRGGGPTTAFSIGEKVGPRDSCPIFRCGDSPILGCGEESKDAFPWPAVWVPLLVIFLGGLVAFGAFCLYKRYGRTFGSEWTRICGAARIALFFAVAPRFRRWLGLGGDDGIHLLDEMDRESPPVDSELPPPPYETAVALGIVPALPSNI